MSKLRFYLLSTLLMLSIGNSVIGPSQAVAQAAAAPTDRLSSAQQHLARQEYAAASAGYQQAFKQKDGTARDYYQAARAAARNKEPKVAVKHLEQAIRKGFYREEYISAETDFAPLTTQATWKRVLAQARKKQHQHETQFDPALVALIKKIGFQDQQYRLVAAEADKKYGLNSPQSMAAMRQQDVVDVRLMAQVDSLIGRHGYPGKSLVGEYLKSTAFLVIQHNPDEKYLPLLTAAADKGELPWASLALLVDRVKTDKGEKQVYGTQPHISPDGRRQLYPVEDEANVNLRRAKIGLGPLEEYLQQFGIAYLVPTAARNPNPPELYVMPQIETVENNVELIGGYEALCANLRYPNAARQAKVSGKVTVQLRVDKAGVPQDVMVVRGLGHGCDEEALRVMRAARFTNPAGQEVEKRFGLPFPYEPKAAQPGQ